MPQRIFLTPLTPRACRARLNQHLAMPFFTWLSESQVDGRTDERGFVIWRVGEHEVARLHGRYERSNQGTRIIIIIERLAPTWPYQRGGFLHPPRNAAKHEDALITFLKEVLEATEVTGEARAG